MMELKQRLENQIKYFEKKYSMNTPDFYSNFEVGKLGDDIDFIEWAATYEMIKNETKSGKNSNPLKRMI